MRRALAACLLSFVLLVPARAQTLPPAPPTVAEAVRLSNDLAYDHAKNTVAYWEKLDYDSDPVYFFKRMLGWTSEGGPDQAVYGLYAVPPSAWHAAIVVPPVAPPAPPPVVIQSVDLSPALNALSVQYELLKDVRAAIADLRAYTEMVGTATRTDIAEFRAAARSRLAAIMTSPYLRYVGAAVLGFVARWKM